MAAAIASPSHFIYLLHRIVQICILYIFYVNHTHPGVPNGQFAKYAQVFEIPIEALHAFPEFSTQLYSTGRARLCFTKS